MKLTEMIERIDSELHHIPRAEKGSAQNTLRMLYNFHRRKDLARRPDAPASSTLLKAIATTTGEYPYFSPSFDHEFFGMGGEC
jgi:hypothetical protein